MAMAVTGTEDTVEATMVATEDTTTARGWFFYSTTYELLYYELLYEMKHQFLRINNSLSLILAIKWKFHRSADAEAEADAEPTAAAEPGYGYYGHGYGHRAYG